MAIQKQGTASVYLCQCKSVPCARAHKETKKIILNNLPACKFFVAPHLFFYFYFLSSCIAFLSLRGKKKIRRTQSTETSQHSLLKTWKRKEVSICK